jgi:hypothetical protein
MLVIAILEPVVAKEIVSGDGSAAVNDKFEVPNVIGSGVERYHFVLPTV